MADGVSGPMVDPEMRALMEAAAAAGAIPDPWTLPIGEARRQFDARYEEINRTLPAMAEIVDLPPEATGVPCAMRLFRPRAGGTGGIYFLHGGGWTFGGIHSHQGIMAALAEASGLAVLGIDYRLAPEHPFPAGLDDSLAGWRWFHRNAGRFGLDPKRLAVAGDSAGANLALATAIAAGPGERPAAGALFYGCFRNDQDTPSHRSLGDGRFGLSSARMEWFWGNYLGHSGRKADPLATPALASLEGLPPLYLSAAGLDPLLDDTVDLASRLGHAGVRCMIDIWPGVTHGFLHLSPRLSVGRRAMAAGGRNLATMLGG